MFKPDDLQRRFLEERIHNSAINGLTETTVFKRQINPELIKELVNLGYRVEAQNHSPYHSCYIEDISNKDISDFMSKYDRISIQWGCSWDKE